LTTAMIVDQVGDAVAAFNEGDTDGFVAHLGRDFYDHVPGADEPTATAMIGGLVRELRAGIPDLRITIDGLGGRADGRDDRVHGRVTVTGTQTGPLWGVPSTGRSLSWTVDVSVRPVAGGLALNLEGLGLPAIFDVLRQIEQINPADQMHLPPIHPTSVPPEFLLRLAFNGQVADKPCAHLDQVRITGLPGPTPVGRGCDDCPPDGVWPTVRMCLTCDHFGCCDTSINKHARAHFEATGHPLMRSIRNGEAWMWCYVDGVFLGRRTLERLVPELGG